MASQDDIDIVVEPPAKRRRLSMDKDNSSLMPSNFASPQYTSSLKVMPQLTDEEKEHEVGIQAFVDLNSTVFIGVLKQRYSDFLVNEILPDGGVVHLRSTKPTKLKVQSTGNGTPQTPESKDDGHSTSVKADSQTPSGSGAPEQRSKATEDAPKDEKRNITEAERTKLVGLLNETAVNEIVHLYQSIVEHPEIKAKDQPVVRTEFTADRSVRSQIHQCIRDIFKSSIESSTDKDGVLVLTAARANTQGWQQTGARNNSNNRGGQRHGKLAWADRGGEYLHFTLFKENKDTMEVVSWLTRNLKANPKSFQFAGTKDRRAVTSQRCSAYRIESERLATQNQNLRGSKVGDFEYHPHGLELGDLGGNEFTVTLRACRLAGVEAENTNITTIQENLQQRMQSLRDLGYLNYYGQQRFGTFSTRTDTIGHYILKEDFRSACDAILEFGQRALEAAQQQDQTTMISQDDRNRALAIDRWRTDNALNAALDILPKKFSAEAHLMRHLSRQPTDFFGALMNIQRNLRMMYVHAYQSRIWNMAATNRMKLYNNSIVKGDLVLVHEHKEAETKKEEATGGHVMAVDADGEAIVMPAGDDRAAREDDVFERARALTEEEVTSGKYSIFDVVLPQPGYDIIYPDNESGTFYKTYMSTVEGGELDPYNMRRKHRDFSLSGAYRKLISRIGEHFEVNVHKYEQDSEQFVKTDLDIMNEERKAKQAGDGNTEQSTVTDENGTNGYNNEEGSKVAVVLKFQLGASQYATMALRELSRGGITQYKPDFSGGR